MDFCRSSSRSAILKQNPVLFLQNKKLEFFKNWHLKECCRIETCSSQPQNHRLLKKKRQFSSCWWWCCTLHYTILILTVNRSHCTSLEMISISIFYIDSRTSLNQRAVNRVSFLQLTLWITQIKTYKRGITSDFFVYCYLMRKMKLRIQFRRTWGLKIAFSMGILKHIKLQQQQHYQKLTKAP